MAKKIITIQLEIELDENEIGKPLHIWAYQFINRLGYEYDVKSFKYNDEAKVVIANKKELSEIPLKEHDSMKPFDRKKHDEAQKVELKKRKLKTNV